MDDMSLVYNIHLCRICQIPEHSDLVKTDTTSGNGDTYLDLMKYIFKDIFWIEDELISLACKTCLEKVADIAEFKRLCLETNGRRGALTFDPVKVEHVAIKLEEDQAVTEQADDGPKADTAPQQRAKRKLSNSDDDAAVDLKSLKVIPKTKRKRKFPSSGLEDLLPGYNKARGKTKLTKKTNPRNRRVIRKLAELERSDSDFEGNAGFEDIDENIDIENVLDGNVAIDADSKENKLVTHAPQYQPNDDEKNCRICKMEFSNLNKLKEHISTNHSKMIYACNICPETCKTQDKLNRHLFRHNGIRNFICTVCGKKYITYADLSHHRMRHVDEAKFACKICPDKKFRTYDSLRKHRVIVHTDPKDYKYLCTECGSKFPSSGGLKVHMFRHSNIKNFPCHMCDKSFCTKAEMQRHLSTHTNMRQFKCDLCPAEYKQKRILLVHKTKRHGIGNYKIRLEEKYECSYCDKKIVSKDKLQRHMRTHTGIKPFKCRLCDQKFICKSYIKGHVRSKHDVNVESPDYKTSLYYDVCDEEASRGDATGGVKAEPRDGAARSKAKKK